MATYTAVVACDRRSVHLWNSTNTTVNVHLHSDLHTLEAVARVIHSTLPETVHAYDRQTFRKFTGRSI